MLSDIRMGIVIILLCPRFNRWKTRKLFCTAVATLYVYFRFRSFF